MCLFISFPVQCIFFYIMQKEDEIILSISTLWVTIFFQELFDFVISLENIVACENIRSSKHVLCYIYVFIIFFRQFLCPIYNIIYFSFVQRNLTTWPVSRASQLSFNYVSANS